MVNAFAVGSPEHSAIGITAGLLRGLDRRELAGVLAHEISHIRRRDTWVMSLADLITRATHGLSVIGQVLLLLNFPLLLMGALTVPWTAVLLLILAPTLSGLLQLALSRAREYDADLGAVELTGDPRGLASALGRLERLNAGWIERIFLPGRRVPDPSLLRTHPSTAERIRRLHELEGRPTSAEPPDRMMPEVPAGAVRIPVRVVRGPRWHLSGLWY
jgi:heat shock protein HtpX